MQGRTGLEVVSGRGVGRPIWRGVLMVEVKGGVQTLCPPKMLNLEVPRWDWLEGGNRLFWAVQHGVA